jgi:hypothetical protein
MFTSFGNAKGVSCFLKLSWGLDLGLLAEDGPINFLKKFTISSVIVLDGLSAQDGTNVIIHQ